jgi:hypothetical protein
MTDYEAMWRNSVEEVKRLTEQNQRLKGDKRENPTVRDQFAMAAVTGMLGHGVNSDAANVSATAYWLADAMMKAREQE